MKLQLKLYTYFKKGYTNSLCYMLLYISICYFSVVVNFLKSKSYTAYWYFYYFRLGGLAYKRQQRNLTLLKYILFLNCFYNLRILFQVPVSPVDRKLLSLELHYEDRYDFT